MLNSETKRHIDAARDVLVGVAPNPTTQIDQITYALIYKFMDDMDQAAIKAGGNPSFFTGDLEPYAWSKLSNSRMGNQEKMNLYSEALTKFSEAKQLPELFRTIFKAAFLPYRSPETLGLFLKEISHFDYSHPEELGNAYEYLLSIMSSQGDAGQFRTPRHIIDFIVEVLNPTKDDKVLDPACGTAGFLVSTYNHILQQHDGKNDPNKKEKPLTPDERKNLMQNLQGYDIDPTMVRIAQVNMYLHQFKNPQIFQYDSLTSEERWSEKFDVILANPPFMSPKGGIKPHNKFSVSSSRAEVLFVDYIINHLRPKGRAGIIVPEGIIFQSGKAYKELRKNLVENGLYAVVSLPGGVFQPYSGVKTSILFLDNELAKNKSEIAFIKVSADGYELGATKREVTQNDLPLAVESLKAWSDGNITENEILSLVVKDEIAENGDYNLSGDRYKVETDFLASNWPIELLSALEDSEILELGRGQIISKTDLLENPGIYPVYSSSAQGNGEFGQYGKYLFNEEMITWSIDGGGRFFYRPQHKFSVTNVCGWLRILKKEKIDAKFLYYVLENQWRTKEFDYVSKAHPSVIREMYKVPLPPLEVQEQIVAELDGYSAIISGSKQIVENWKPIIEVNPEWELKTLGDVADIISGQSPEGKFYNDTGNGTPFYQGKTEFTDLYIGPPTKWTTQVTKLSEPGDILMSVRAPVGPVNLNNETICIGRGLAAIRVKNINRDYLFAVLVKNESKIKGNGGAVFDSITKSQIEELQIPLPPVKVQEEIANSIILERAQMVSVKKLIETYEARIQAVIVKLWNK